ncbi:transmembrane protein [Cystoisospora suis]|uniref:Transmembrane protein n=1 Tax=Cystoisospora suis TaxID=483139 RepID=A0A2C6KYU0_9APIC|nr:transmembrane protein [Cystoisospora suis]
MEEFSGCICHFLSSLIGGVRGAITNVDSLSMPTDLGNVGPVADGTGGAMAALPQTTQGTDSGMSPAQVAALIVLFIVMVLSFFQNSTSANTNTKRANGRNRDNNGEDGRRDDRPGPSVA